MLNQQNSIDWKKLQGIVIELRAESPEIAPEIERGIQLVALNTIMHEGANSYRIFDPAMQQWVQVEFLVKWSCSCPMHDEAKPAHWWMGGFQSVCPFVVAAGLFWASYIPVEAGAMHNDNAPGHVLAGAMPVEAEAMHK